MFSRTASMRLSSRPTALAASKRSLPYTRGDNRSGRRVVRERQGSRPDRDSRSSPHFRFSASNSSRLRGQSEPSNRDKLRSASTLPPVWQRTQ